MYAWHDADGKHVVWTCVQREGAHAGANEGWRGQQQQIFTALPTSAVAQAGGPTFQHRAALSIRGCAEPHLWHLLPLHLLAHGMLRRAVKGGVS